MSVSKDSRRRRRRLLYFGVFFCLVVPLLPVLAIDLPEDAPILISEPDSTRALAFSRGGRRTLNPRVFPPGAGTRIVFYLTNLDLLPNEDATAFRADMQDSRYFRYPLEVLSIEPTPDRKWVYEITVRLHAEIGDVGDVLMRVAWRGMSSNRVRVSIGHEGGKVQDDEGAAPTPMPDRPIVHERPAEISSLPWTGDRVRFMQQATFGVEALAESQIRRFGYSTWLEQQMEERRDANGDLRYSTFPYPTHPQMPTNPPVDCNGTTGVNDPTDPDPLCFKNRYSVFPLQTWFFREALYGNDQQLRRRVSWALSQIFVVGGKETVQSRRMLEYIRILDRNAFGNYRNLLREITLNPAMGNYLDMAISTQQNPNENYAREILQLFSIGVDQLNPDGRPVLDGNGNRIPSYDQNTVNNFTKVFTGWTFCNTEDCPNAQAGTVNYIDQLRVNPVNHDSTQKLLFGGTILPAGLSPQDDFDQALDNIFYHPNVGPFVSKLLIQQLVTSNPTPAYVGRVAAVFDGNSAGVRGDMKAVIRAILLDPEARGNLKTDPDYGHLREPVLLVTNVVRPMNPISQAGGLPACNGLSDGVLNVLTLPLEQDVFQPPSVFNYYPMDYRIPSNNLAGPEFAIFSTGTALKRPNFVNQMSPPNSAAAGGVLINNVVANVNYAPCGTRLTFTRLQSLSQQDATGGLLVDTLNRELLNGSMSANVRTSILNSVQAVTAADGGLKRARTALYLVATSSQFQVQR